MLGEPGNRLPIWMRLCFESYYSHHHYRTCRIIIAQCQRQLNTRNSRPRHCLSMSPLCPIRGCQSDQRCSWFRFFTFVCSCLHSCNPLFSFLTTSGSPLSRTPSSPLWVNDHSYGGTFSSPLFRSTKIDPTSQETGDFEALQMTVSIVMGRAIVTRGRDPNDMDNREASNDTLKSTHRE